MYTCQMNASYFTTSRRYLQVSRLQTVEKHDVEKRSTSSKEVSNAPKKYKIHSTQSEQIKGDDWSLAVVLMQRLPIPRRIALRCT